MPHVEQIIDAINVFDIKVVVVIPAHWPPFSVPERVAAVLEAVIPADHPGTPHVERVVMTEMGTVIGVRNAAIMAGVAATVVSNGLWLLPSGLLSALWLCFLGTLWLRFLGTLWLCFLGTLWLCFLGTLWLCFLGTLWLCFLGTLWLCFLGTLWLCFLGTLWLCFLGTLWLRFLCVLRLLLVLRRRLRFSSASALFLLAFLCECRKGGSEK